MTITHRAHAESEHFSYEGFGETEEAARQALLEGLRAHARQMDTAAAWPEEVLATASVHGVRPGVSLYCSMDPGLSGHELAVGVAGAPIAYRAAVDTHYGDHGLGSVDGYGATAEEARGVCALGVAVVHADRPDHLAMVVEEIETYPIEAGAAFRGGLVGNVGERIA